MELKYTQDDLELLIDFLDEVGEGLESIEESILRLEEERDDDIINALFRSMHTIKGTSGYLALNHVKHLAHESEDLVSDVRSTKIQITPEVVELLLESVDLLKQMFEHLKDAAKKVDKEESNIVLALPDVIYEPVIKRIQEVRSKKTDAAQGASAEKAEEKIPELTAEVKQEFLKKATPLLEQFKTALKDYENNHEIEEKKSAALASLEESIEKLIECTKTIAYPSLLEKVAEVHNLLEFLRTGEPEMALVMLESIQELLKSAEQGIAALSKVKKTPPKRTTGTRRSSDLDLSTIRVPGERLDKFMNLIGELTVTKNVFGGLSEELRVKHELPDVGRRVREVGNQISRLSEDLQSSIMEIRMMPVKVVFSRFNRMVFDLAKKTNKPLKLVMEGENTELDKSVIEKIGDPLVHMIRNSADHGIETPYERECKGKSREGTITLCAVNQGQQVLIQVKDDGKGLPRDKIGQKAVERGLITEERLKTLTDPEVFSFVMAPGFSTAEKVTEVSGRGVGMDVVRANIEKIGGTISISSVEDQGSTVTLAIPLSLTVTRGLQVEASGEIFILPLENVLETVKVPTKQVRNFKGNQVLAHRGRVLSVVNLSAVLEMPCASEEKEEELNSLVILQLANQTVALDVDRFYKEVDILIKPLEGALGQLDYISGASIQSDGSVVLILNPSELF